MFNLNSIFIFTLSSLLGASVGQIVEFGQCNPNIALVANFDIQRFAGIWYEIQRSDSPDQTTECARFSFTSANNVINVQHNGVDDNFLQSSTGTATVAAGTAQVSLNLPMFGGARNFWVLLTDYDDFAVTYSCENLSATQRRTYLWVLSRQSTYSSQLVQNYIDTSLNFLLGIPLNSLKIVDHSDTACFELPVIAPGQSIVIPGQCDANIPVQQNFNVAEFTGTWHQIASYYTESSTGTCVKAQYSVGDGVVDVLNSQVINQALLTITGTATVSSNDNSARLRVILNIAPGQTVEQDLWVLSTDYTNYAISYSCENVSATQRRIYSWILSRARELSAAAQLEVNRVIGSVIELNDRYFINTDQSATACFYFPEPNGQPVQFPGQCDANISPLANFDAARYLGTWYDVESYPAPFQTGTCSKAEYSLNADGTVRVENTQVLNQGLETWIGSAVLSADGTASLDVTFNVNGQDVTSKYWVLGTDYTTYALVYSCTDIDGDSRLVYSWKLSRTATLPAAANTAITTILNTIQVLDQRYYVARGHTDADCFYYPDNNGGDVVLSGQCVADNLVPAVTNFNPTLFAGTWHEISRFPSGIQEGDCVASQYTLSGTNAFTIAQTAVNNERLTTATIQATTSNDGRGVISAVVTGVPFTNVFILATDYTDYALAYSCRNIGTTSKQIYSWKLSRSSTGLSANANNVINGLVSNNDDLWENYYRTTGQDNNACFHYPVYAQPPAFIELLGSCPTTIRGVANFDASAYLGRWYETARYPLQDQFGQCSRAEYSLGATRVEVSNTEVVDQTLSTQTGYADVASTDGTGLLNVEFNVNGVVVTANYYILATDYTSYSLVYSCTNLPNGNRRVSSWKLSRTPTLSIEAAAAMVPLITSTQGLTEEYYQPTSQTDESCFYIPTVNANQAPLFRGQCETITGVAGFDSQRYAGWWHEIERYPVDGTAGECRSSEYSLDASSYRVVDTYVQNNQGTVLSGTVTVSTNGRLQRTMSDGTTQDIWVLATDYDNYALLYSCENVGTEYRRVWSAKHSKTRSLTDAAQNAMASIITNNMVLYNQFYLRVDQTDATCFYYPSITQGRIIIPGQCDANIPVVQNFNIENFAGVWNHTERYDDLGGSSCIGSRYTVEDGARNTGITVLNYEVRGGELQTVEGSARLTSTDDSASIELTFPVGDSEATTTSTVYVLATDYTSYALAYSCANVNTLQREVRAWKLSRTRTLTAAGTTAINNLIQQRQELYQPYFKQIEQNEECPEPSSALIVKTSIIMLLVCAMLQRVL